MLRYKVLLISLCCICFDLPLHSGHVCSCHPNHNYSCSCFPHKILDVIIIGSPVHSFEQCMCITHGHRVERFIGVYYPCKVVSTYFWGNVKIIWLVFNSFLTAVDLHYVAYFYVFWLFHHITLFFQTQSNILLFSLSRGQGNFRNIVGGLANLAILRGYLGQVERFYPLFR